MISRRLFASGLTASAAALVSAPAKAGSLFDLFAPRRRVVIVEEPVLLQDPGLTASIAVPEVKIKPKPVKKAKARKPKATAPYKVDPQFEPQQVRYIGPLQPGSVLVDSDEKFLYLIQPNDTARRYAVAVGKEGLGWKGAATVKAKVQWPSWKPTPEMIKRSPDHYARYKDGMPGGPGNPLGARAIYLYQGSRDTHIRIHGTTQPWTIGQAASNGCFRMVNEHVMDLFDRISVGTQVIVI
jgi:lipoprotein-anchoring transpeptidase ErfK/SrfK